MIIQFLINFLLTLILLNIYLINIKFNSLIDNNAMGFGSKKKTKTASGIIFSLVLVLNLILLFFNLDELLPNRFYILLLSIIFLSLISFYDDLKSLDPRLRLVSQAIIIYFSLTLINLNYIDLPIKLKIFIFLLLWIYTSNITNFIDGSDGYLTVNAIFFFLGIIIIDIYNPNLFFSYHLALIMLPILTAFIYFNKPPAKLYMGDTGSIIIGYIIGFCILELVSRGELIIAVSLYCYPFIDCTLTLSKKIVSGKSIFARDFDYFFLRPIKRKQNNNYIVLVITIIFNLLNLFNIFLISYFETLYLVVISIILSFVKIFVFTRLAK